MRGLCGCNSNISQNRPKIPKANDKENAKTGLFSQTFRKQHKRNRFQTTSVGIALAIDSLGVGTSVSPDNVSSNHEFTVLADRTFKRLTKL